MYAYIKNNEIQITSTTELDETFLPNISEFEMREYSDEIKDPMLKDGEIVEKEKTESEQQKFSRIFAYLSNPENPLEVEKLEGLEFNDEQIGNIILARVFNNNPHGQTALQTKVIAMIMAKKENPELMTEISQKMEKINEVRIFFDLEPITF